MTEGDEVDPAPSRGALWPFAVAVTIVVIGLVVVVLINVLRPASERLDDSALISRAVNDQYSARNSLDYNAYRKVSCARVTSAPGFPTEERFVAENRRDRESHGQLVIDGIDDTNVAGSTAMATVRWHRTDAASDKRTSATSLAKESDSWKVCDTGR